MRGSKGNQGDERKKEPIKSAYKTLDIGNLMVKNTKTQKKHFACGLWLVIMIKHKWGQHYEGIRKIDAARVGWKGC